LSGLKRFGKKDSPDLNSQDFNRLHIPPHNIEAEQACLGACLIDAEALDRISEVLSGEEDFYREAHTEIYTAMITLAEGNSNIDLITVCDRLRDLGKLEQVGGAAYLDSMVTVVGSSAHAVSYAKIVSETATERRLQQAGQQIQRIAGEGELDVADKVDQAEELVFSVADRRKTQQLEHVKPILEVTFDELYERYQQKEEITGIASGFRELDAMTAGFQKSNLIILAARPSMGKTAFVLSMAQNIVLNKKRPATVAMFSLEMASTELCQRVLCSVARVNAQDVRTGRMREEDWQAITRAMNQLNEAPLFIDDTAAITPLEMKAKCRRLQKRHGLDMVIIDYLQLMKGGTKIENRAQEISQISRQLKMLSKELNIPVVALSQVGRGVEQRQDKRPGLSDLRESGAIEQDADLVAFIYRDEYYHPQTEDIGIAEIIIGKQRSGPVGTCRLSFVKRFAAFENLEEDREAPMPTKRIRPPDDGFEVLDDIEDFPL
jgi:replicative DNA helicase